MVFSLDLDVVLTLGSISSFGLLLLALTLASVGTYSQSYLLVLLLVVLLVRTAADTDADISTDLIGLVYAHVLLSDSQLSLSSLPYLVGFYIRYQGRWKQVLVCHS